MPTSVNGMDTTTTQFPGLFRVCDGSIVVKASNALCDDEAQALSDEVTARVRAGLDALTQALVEEFPQIAVQVHS